MKASMLRPRGRSGRRGAPFSGAIGRFQTLARQFSAASPISGGGARSGPRAPRRAGAV